MRFLNFYLPLAVTLSSMSFIATSCNKEDVGGVASENDSIFLTFSAHNEMDDCKSRTQIGEGDKVFWKKGDALSVFNKKESSSSRFSTEDNDVTDANFSGYIISSKDDTYWALYPYNTMSKFNLNTRKLSTFINPEQTVPTDGGYDPKACHSFAFLSKGRDGGHYGTFKLLGGMLALKFNMVDLKSPLRKVEISLDDQTAPGHPHLAGNYVVDMSDKDAPVPVFDEAQSHEIIVRSTAGFKSGTEYLVALPPMSNTTLKLSFVLEDERVMVKRLKGFSLERAYIKPAKELPLSDSEFNSPETFLINTADEFVNWYNNSDDFNQYRFVKLAGNIDLSDKGVLTTRKFTGVFDGGGYTISNVTVKKSTDDLAGLFGKLSSATVKNLTLKNFIVDGEMAFHAGSIAAYIQANTTVENCKVIDAKLDGYVAGGLVGRADRSTITACEISNVNVTALGVAGGILGYASVDNIVTASYVSGSVSAGPAGFMAPVGGILGAYESVNTVKGCYSSVSLSGKKPDMVGGIYGGVNGGSSVELNKESVFYVGSSNVWDTFNKLDISELPKKILEFNSSISNTGYEYIINPESVTNPGLPIVVRPKKQ